jgi:hypothetical protein
VYWVQISLRSDHATGGNPRHPHPVEGDRVGLYTSDLAVTADGMVYCTTTWEEGHRAAGIYRDGDALTDVPTFGTTAGACVAVIAGDFLFVGYEQRMDVLVLHHRDLTPVGRIHIGPQSQTPIFDGPSELIAARDGSSYDLFTAQYTGNATTHVRWTPGRSGLPSPTLLVARRAEKGVELTWGEAAEASEFSGSPSPAPQSRRMSLRRGRSRIFRADAPPGRAGCSCPATSPSRSTAAQRLRGY